MAVRPVLLLDPDSATKTAYLIRRHRDTPWPMAESEYTVPTKELHVKLDRPGVHLCEAKQHSVTQAPIDACFAATKGGPSSFPVPLPLPADAQHAMLKATDVPPPLPLPSPPAQPGAAQSWADGLFLASPS